MASLAVLSDWATTLSLIFGGCCSNALTLEQLTSQHPNAGSLITFAQFLLISLHGLPKFIVFTPWPMLRPRRIPLAPYLVQVALFYCLSLLNNAAFGYNIPMPVHIIFRSGGLVISMLMGWLLVGKRYTQLQVASVLLVTAGVILTTLSASSSSSKARAQPKDGAVPPASAYATGIAILTLALVLSGFLGLVQDWTYTRYTRSPAPAPAPAKDKSKGLQPAEPWQESMFYLHFLSLPMFLFIRTDLVAQHRALQANPQLVVDVPWMLHTLRLRVPTSLSTFLGLRRQWALPPSVALPAAYVPLALTTLTALVCVAGVNRLTSRVSSLTVTLLLVVRKAVSLVISIVLFRSQGADTGRMWAGAAMVFLGTMGYAAGSQKKPPVKAKGKVAGGEKVKAE